MRFAVENVGKVSSADITLNGVTVISGPNGSGKSTINRMLVTWCSVLRRLEELVAIERVKSILFGINQFLESNDLPPIRLNFAFERRQTIKNLLNPEFWAVRENLQWVMGSASPLGSMPGIRELIDGRVDRWMPHVERFVKIAESVAKRDDAEYIREIVASSLSGVLGTVMAGPGLFDAQSTIASWADNGKRRWVKMVAGGVVESSGLEGNHLPSAFYIEPIHALDLCSHMSFSERYDATVMTRYHVGDLNWANVLHSSIDTNEWSIERKQQQREIQKELDELVAMIHGRVASDRRELYFHDSDIGRAVSVLNAASGCKSIAQIEVAIRNGYIGPGSLLVCDEPESNLHPEWQVKFARFLVLLNAKLDVRVLLNTHSPFFLKAILVYADMLERGEFCSYYNMVPHDGGPYYDAEQVAGVRVEEVFRQMREPFAKLVYGEHYGNIPR